MDGAIDLFSWILPTFIFVIIFYFLYEQSNNVWEKKKVPTLKRKYVFGNAWPALTFKRSMGQWFQDIYRKAGDHPYIGFYVFNKPAILIKDPAILRQILVKDFNNFVNRNFDVDKELDPAAHGNIFFNTSPRWRHVRNKNTPMFTTARIKFMFSLSAEIAGDLYTKISKESDSRNVIDVSEVTAQYATDIICSVAMGFKANCLTDTDSKYRRFGKELFDDSTFRGLQFFTIFFTPWLGNLLRWRAFPPELVNLLESTVNEIARYREESNVQRNDLVELLTNLKKDNKDPLTHSEILGSIVSFFGAGFETTASTMSFTLYELAFHQDIQDLVRSEIKNALAESDGKITYELVQNLKLLELCIDEALRKYPLLGFLDRKCLNDYKVPGTDLVIPAGTAVYVSLDGLQNDPKYFPDPEKFDPYRFSEERKQEIVPYTYMPFGEGPRNCIGMRLGLVNVKTGLLRILSHFKVEPCAETPRQPLEMAEKAILNRPKENIKLRFIPLADA